MNENKTNQELTIEIVSTIGAWFLSSLFIWLGWKVLVTHFGLPYLTYWEIFFMRVGFGSIMKMAMKIKKILNLEDYI